VPALRTERHDQLTEDQLQGLSDSITALSESVGQVAAVVADQ
jgi:iron uptake system component EfeO